jgi:hypothetical protein
MESVKWIENVIAAGISSMSGLKLLVVWTKWRNTWFPRTILDGAGRVPLPSAKERQPLGLSPANVELSAMPRPVLTLNKEQSER